MGLMDSTELELGEVAENFPLRNSLSDLDSEITSKMSLAYHPCLPRVVVRNVKQDNEVTKSLWKTALPYTHEQFLKSIQLNE